MTELKRDILKKLVVSKEVTQAAVPYVDMTKSILIRGLDDVEVEPKAILFEDFNPMFNDFMTLTEAEGRDGLVTDALLMRIARSKGEFIGSIFIKGLLDHLPNHYSYITSFIISDRGVGFKHFPKFLKKGVSNSAEDFIKTLTRILYIASTYTPELINPEQPIPNKLFYKKLSRDEKELYKEYTIDISKPRKVIQSGSSAPNNDPISRAEHERRGHWRTSKLGKRFFVRQTTVKKGATRKIVKDYKV